MNRLSTARCVPQSVYIGFRLFVLLGGRSGDVSAMLWKVRGRLVSWANSFVGTQSCPTPPRHPAVCPDPTRPRYVRVLDSTSMLPSHTASLSPCEVQPLALAIIGTATCSPNEGCSTTLSPHKITCRIPNPDIPRAGRVGAPGGTAGRGRAGLGANRFVRPGNTSPVYPPRDRRNVA